jgi:hypothetical protein
MGINWDPQPQTGAAPATPTPAAPQGGGGISWDTPALDELRTPAMRQRIRRLAATTKTPWQQLEAQLADTSRQTGRGVDVLVSSMEQTVAPKPTGPTGPQPLAQPQPQPQPLTGPQAAQAAPAASQAAAAQLRSQGVPGPQRAGAAAQVEQRTAQQPQAGGIRWDPRAQPQPVVPPSWAQQAARNLPGAVGEAINQLWNPNFAPNVALEKGLSGVMWALGRPAEITEHLLTGGSTYDQTWLKNIQNPTERTAANIALKVLLDPTNILMFPAGVAKALTLAARAGEATAAAAKAAGLSDVIANAAGIGARALVNGRMGPQVQWAIEAVVNGASAARRALDITAALPKDARIMARNHLARQAYEARNASNLLNDLFTKIPSESDRALLVDVIEGTKPVSSLSPEMFQHLQDVRKIQDGQTDRMVLGGFTDHANDNYIMHLYPAADKQQQLALKGIPPSEFKAQAAQVLPGPRPLGTTLPGASRRTFPTNQDAITAGLHPIRDVARSLAAKELSVGLAENNMHLWQDLSTLGLEWVLPEKQAPSNWVKAGNIVGNPTANRVIIPGGKRLATVAFHPEVANFGRELTHMPDTHSWLTGLTAVTGGIKRVVFSVPFFHGANIWRAAFEGDGMRVFNPRNYQEWRTLAEDARTGGPWSEEFLNAGGSMDSSAIRAIRNTMNDIFTKDPAAAVVKQQGLTWRDLASPKVLGQRFVEWGDNLIWNNWDKGARLSVYKHLRTEMGMGPEEAAKQVNLIMNDYSRTGLTKIERDLTNAFFTYSWQKGRMRLFGNMARAFFPTADLTTAERALMNRVVQRWTMTNIVMPHLVRALQGRASAGLFAGRIQIGQVPDGRGGYRPVYIAPTGFMQDGINFLTAPGQYAVSHIGPLVRLTAAIINANKTAQLTGQTVGQVMTQAVGQEFGQVIPAGAGTALRLGQGLWQDPIGTLTRAALPFLGVPEYTTPPPPEDPKVALHDAMLDRDWSSVARIIRTHHLGLPRIAANLPYQDRIKLERAWNHLQPHLPGLPRLAPRLP